MDNLFIVAFIGLFVCALTGHRKLGIALALLLFVGPTVFALIEGVFKGNAYGIVALCLFFAYLGHEVTKDK